MKKIFVSVKEFLDNGGELEVGRPIYWDNRTFKDGDFVGWHSLGNGKEYIDLGRDFPIPLETARVEIECSPIWK